jgi:PAS domain S-box-containing protein
MVKGSQNGFSQMDFLAAIVKAMPVAVFCKDYSKLPGKFVAWNKAAERLWGLDAGDVLGKSDYDFFPKEQADYFQTKDLETLCSADVQYIPEEAVDSPTIGRRLVRTWKVALATPGQAPSYLLGISLDVTEERKLAENVALERQKALLAAKLASLGEMAGGIAHEINNPLTVILGQVEIIKMSLSEPGLDLKQLGQSLDRVQKNVSRISRIVDGLLKFARDGSQNPMREASVNDLMRDTMMLCEQQIRNLGIQLSVQYLETDKSIWCREIELSQVIMNLVNNARAAVVGSEKAWIKLEVSHRGDGVEIAVSDSGQRPSDEVVQRLFTPFFTTKPVGQGTGLGLSICRGLIENHGGKIWLDADSPTTRFVVYLPNKAAASKIAS